MSLVNPRSLTVGRRPATLLTGAAAAFAAVLLILASAANAAFPGTPGPIVYPKSRTESDGTLRYAGLFTHGPRIAESPEQLTFALGDVDAAYSRSGRRIVFSARRGSPFPRRHIFTMRNDGTAIEPVTSGPYVDANPYFFPGGGRIVFERKIGGRTHIFTVRPDGSDLEQLTYGPHTDSDPTVSPNGRRIAFVTDRIAIDSSDTDIFSMRRNGTHKRILVDGPWIEEAPDYAPNGRRIAYDSDRGRGSSNIFVAAVNGRRVRKITHSRGDCFRGTCFSKPAFAPDGRHIAMLGSSRYSTEIAIVRSGGGGNREFDSGGTETNGFGTRMGAPGWGPEPR